MPSKNGYTLNEIKQIIDYAKEKDISRLKLKDFEFEFNPLSGNPFASFTEDMPTKDAGTVIDIDERKEKEHPLLFAST